MDNVQFQFSMALKPAKAGAEALKSKLEKIYATKLRGYSPDQMVACTIVFEGSEAEVRNQERQLYGIAEKHGGMKAGASNGEKGYQLTYSIAYIRDFVMNHYVLAESFETSVAWSQVRELCERVKERVHAEHIALGLPGLPFISCRVTQTYDTGVCVYFYLAYYYKDVDKPSEIYSKLEHAARDEVLLRGGSLSHHHGVGKLRSTFMERIESPDLSRLKLKVKESMDPGNVFGANNHMAPSQAN